MRQLMACLALIGVLVKAQIVYPQTMKIHSVDEGAEGSYTVTLSDNRSFLYGFDTDSGDWTVGELVAVIMYDNMTVNDPTDDEVIAARHTGFFEAGGGQR